MNILIEYFKKIGWKRFLIMILGNVFLGMGISIFKYAGLGNDSYTGMTMALSDVAGISFANFLIMTNIAVFLLELVFGKDLIGVGTIVNAVFIGYIVTFFNHLWLSFWGTPKNLLVRILIMLLGMIVTGFGVAMYQVPNVGVSPYDSLSIIMTRKITKIPYFWHRIFTDVICAVICFLTGGIVGLGTLASTLGLGPIINFFSVHIIRKLFDEEEDVL